MRIIRNLHQHWEDVKNLDPTLAILINGDAVILEQFRKV